MRVLSELEPKNVFSFFEDICNVPHPSYKEEKISNYLVDFAKERKLEYYQDSLNNVIIIKEASKGYEDAAPIILQGHMDMVCEKTPDCDKNMDEDGLDLEVNGDFISAKGTTLGGDDGIAVAYALASIIPSSSLSILRSFLPFNMDTSIEEAPSMPTSSDTVHTNSRRGCAILSSSSIASA